MQEDGFAYGSQGTAFARSGYEEVRLAQLGLAWLSLARPVQYSALLWLSVLFPLTVRETRAKVRSARRQHCYVRERSVLSRSSHPHSLA